MGFQLTKLKQFFLGKLGAGLACAFALLALWELASTYGFYNPYLFPPPSRIGKSFIDMLIAGQWTNDLMASLFRYICGFVIGNILGVTIGLLTGRMLGFRNALTPLLNFLRSTPSIALVPLAIVWFGIGELEKILVVIWGVTFPVWLNTHSGVAEVEQEYVWAARSLGSSKWDLLRSVYFQRAIPYVIAGSRTSIATGFFALAAAEMGGAFSGTAFRIFHSHQMFQTDKMMVSILTIGFLSLILDRLFVWLMRWRLPWWQGDNIEQR
jgi:ABC-type nitrate/sulfonate/bicarbonate transport system permease component